MRSVFLSFLLIFCATVVSAEQLKVKVVSPDQQTVSNARVVVYGDRDRVIASANTASDGVAQINLHNGTYDVQVLVPGFARASEQSP